MSELTAEEKINQWIEGGLTLEIQRRKDILAEQTQIVVEMERELALHKEQLPLMIDWCRAWISSYDEASVRDPDPFITSRSTEVVIGHYWPKESGPAIKVAAVYVLVEVLEENGDKNAFETLILAPPYEHLRPYYIDSLTYKDEIRCSFPVEGRDPDDDRECFDEEAVFMRHLDGI